MPVVLSCDLGTQVVISFHLPIYSMELDIAIVGGIVVDGTGNAPYAADIGIKEDNIVVIVPKLDNYSARRMIQATNKIVCPGFIDIHSHSDIKGKSYLLLVHSHYTPIFVIILILINCDNFDRAALLFRCCNKISNLLGYLCHLVSKGLIICRTDLCLSESK
jgi:hypothetical protein